MEKRFDTDGALIEYGLTAAERVVIGPYLPDMTQLTTSYSTPPFAYGLRPEPAQPAFAALWDAVQDRPGAGRLNWQERRTARYMLMEVDMISRTPGYYAHKLGEILAGVRVDLK